MKPVKKWREFGITEEAVLLNLNDASRDRAKPFPDLSQFPVSKKEGKKMEIILMLKRKGLSFKVCIN